MYKIIGADGKDYGPATLDQVKRWVAEGRVNPQTQVLSPEVGDWRTASDVPELQEALKQRAATLGGTASAGMDANAPSGTPKKGLAITSLILGLLSVVCFLFITGLPAIICGHIAYSRARRDPTRYSGAGMAIAGLVLGYASIVLSVLLAAAYLPELGKAKSRAQTIACDNNLKQIGLAYRIWALDHDDRFPASVSTNDGGALELSRTALDSKLIEDPAPQFAVMSNELATPLILVCPQDNSKSAAASFNGLSQSNISYQVMTYSGIETNLTERFILCPIHNRGVRVDGAIQGSSR
jgi:competence protein ComGC